MHRPSKRFVSAADLMSGSDVGGPHAQQHHAQQPYRREAEGTNPDESADAFRWSQIDWSEQERIAKNKVSELKRQLPPTRGASSPTPLQQRSALRQSLRSAASSHRASVLNERMPWQNKWGAAESMARARKRGLALAAEVSTPPLNSAPPPPPPQAVMPPITRTASQSEKRARKNVTLRATDRELAMLMEAELLASQEEHEHTAERLAERRRREVAEKCAAEDARRAAALDALCDDLLAKAVEEAATWASAEATAAALTVGAGEGDGSSSGGIVAAARGDDGALGHVLGEEYVEGAAPRETPDGAPSAGAPPNGEVGDGLHARTAGGSGRDDDGDDDDTEPPSSDAAGVVPSAPQPPSPLGAGSAVPGAGGSSAASSHTASPVVAPPPAASPVAGAARASPAPPPRAPVGSTRLVGVLRLDPAVAGCEAGCCAEGHALHLPRTIALPSAPGEALVVGRCEGCDVRLDSLLHRTMVSRRHCVFRAQAAAGDAAEGGDARLAMTWRLQDASSNGTSVNHVRVAKGGHATVAAGDVVLFGARGVSEARYTCEVRRVAVGAAAQEARYAWAEDEVGPCYEVS